jgi:predicted TIM-barrel fold metal-dependent hydrolase
MLFNPTASPGYEIDLLQTLSQSGIRGVRVNPAIWGEFEVEGGFGGHDGLVRLMKRCGELGYPVSFLGMNGYTEIRGELLKLMDKVPTCPILIDHFGFSEVDGMEGDISMESMLDDLRQIPHGGVKASAGFRCMDGKLRSESMTRGWDMDELWGKHYEGIIKRRLEPLVIGLGDRKVMWGSDEPWLGKIGGGMEREIKAMTEWVEGGEGRERVMGENTKEWYWGNERGYGG